MRPENGRGKDDDNVKTFKLHLIRHGLTRGNLEGLYVGGGTDLPLCDEGRHDLEVFKSRFVYPAPDTVFTSPLARAVETADLLFPAASHRLVVPQLREANFGVFEGHKMEELVKDPEFARWMDPTSGFVPEGAEPTKEFHARCADTLHKLLEYMIRSEVTEAACVTHGGVIMSMLAQSALPRRPAQQWMADPGCGYTVQTDVAMWMRDELVEAVAIQPAGYMDEE